MKIRLYCPHGFSYEGYQRVFVTTESDRAIINDENTAEEIMVRANIEHICGGDDGKLYRSNCSLFVLSGESFTLADFADAVATMMKCKVEFKDGDGEWESV